MSGFSRLAAAWGSTSPTNRYRSMVGVSHPRPQYDEGVPTSFRVRMPFGEHTVDGCKDMGKVAGVAWSATDHF
ncbi:hypothetical protein YIM730264_19940 [Thermus hydrothermalis]